MKEIFNKKLRLKKAKQAKQRMITKQFKQNQLNELDEQLRLKKAKLAKQRMINKQLKQNLLNELDEQLRRRENILVSRIEYRLNATIQTMINTTTHRITDNLLEYIGTLFDESFDEKLTEIQENFNDLYYAFSENEQKDLLEMLEYFRDKSQSKYKNRLIYFCNKLKLIMRDK